MILYEMVCGYAGDRRSFEAAARRMRPEHAAKIRATLRPWAWFDPAVASLRADSRVRFQRGVAAMAKLEQGIAEDKRRDTLIGAKLRVTLGKANGILRDLGGPVR